jgi:hydroxymethylpyrimidine kinase/phosphomethylpyrimidine kinase
MTGQIVRDQLDALSKDQISISSIKVGMIPDEDAVSAVCEFAKQNNIPMVVDPVLASGSGNVELTHATLEAHLELMKLAAVVTPNTREAFRFVGPKTDPLVLAQAVHARVGGCVLLKGGHRIRQEDPIVDVWCDNGGARFLETLPSIDEDVRGTGCQLSSAIAAGLAKGDSPEAATHQARRYLNTLLFHRRARIGNGRAIIIRVDDD